MLRSAIEVILRLLFRLAASYSLAVFAHEAGHALIGKLHGGTLLLFRIGRIVWIAESRRCFIGRKSCLSPGQCVMACSSRKACIRIAAGGCLANFLTALVAAGIRVRNGSLFGKGWEELLWKGDFCLFFITVSLLMSAMNWFLIFCPDGEVNDGWLWRHLRSDSAICEDFLKEQQKCRFLLEEGQIAEIME